MKMAEYEHYRQLRQQGMKHEEALNAVYEGRELQAYKHVRKDS